MTEPHVVEASLNGFFDPSFSTSEKLVMSFAEPPSSLLPPQKTRIHDARALQTEAGAPFSEPDFFAENGFVLLPHRSTVEDWELDVAMPDPNSDVMQHYLPEVEEIIRTRLMPGQNLEIFQPPPMRRGPGSPNPEYGAGVHADYGLTADDLQEGIAAFTSDAIAAGWRARYDQDDVVGAMVINLWRPVYLEGRLQHMPLAVCAPATVRREDVVPIGIPELTPTGRPTNQSSLRAHPDQRWVYYPGMTCDEVFAFKNFQCMKDDAEPSVNLCFHTAFEEPGTPAGIPERQSVEHRVMLTLLRD